MRALRSFLKRFKVSKDLHQAIHAPRVRRREIELAAIESLALPANLEFQKNAALGGKLPKTPSCASGVPG